MPHLAGSERPRAARLLAAAALALLSVLAATGTAAARVESSDAHASRPGSPPPGYDISYPQCGSDYPVNAAFGIVGVNRGIVFSANPCLGDSGGGESQLAWAGMNAGLYANTGNPGPNLSSHWPLGQTSPRPCATPEAPDPDSLDCAFDYGWNAAADSYADAVAAYISLGWAPGGATRTPVANAWWLDVETANSWRTDVSRNIAALQGAVGYLRSVGAASVGFYSTTRMWTTITGGTTAFADLPSWVAGASSVRTAASTCTKGGFTGGPVQLAQYLASGFDADRAC